MNSEALVGERRRQPRYPCDLTAVCSPVMGSEVEGWPARVVEISRGGVRFVAPHRLETDAVLQVRLARSTGGVTTPLLLARVAHARRHDDGEWLIGCHLAQQIADEDLFALLGDLLSRGGLGGKSMTRNHAGS